MTSFLLSRVSLTSLEKCADTCSAIILCAIRAGVPRWAWLPVRAVRNVVEREWDTRMGVGA